MYASLCMKIKIPWNYCHTQSFGSISFRRDLTFIERINASKFDSAVLLTWNRFQICSFDRIQTAALEVSAKTQIIWICSEIESSGKGDNAPSTELPRIENRYQNDAVGLCYVRSVWLFSMAPSLIIYSLDASQERLPSSNWNEKWYENTQPNDSMHLLLINVLVLLT